MSATGRGTEREKDDFYKTPKWVVRSFRDNVHLPGGDWLEPCAGDGRIIEVISETRNTLNWFANELREEERPKLLALPELGETRVQIGSFLDYKPPHYAGDGGHFNVAVTNPPYAIAQPIIMHAMTMADYVVMLLRTNFLGSKERHEWLKRCPPDLYQLAHRPSFKKTVKYVEVKTPEGVVICDADGKPKLQKKTSSSDSCEYAWFVWEHNPRRAFGRVFFLPPMSKTERKG